MRSITLSRLKTAAMFGLLAAALSCALSAWAGQNSDTATAAASAKIVAPIAITNTAGLNFGQVIGLAGDVTVSTLGARTSTVNNLGSATGIAAAAFTITGEPSNTFAITLPGSITIASGENEMTVDTFASSLGATGTLTGGTATLTVGATLHVNNSQATGEYTGNFDVMVAYN